MDNDTAMDRSIHIKRAYDAPSPDDGYRVLVDRLWPRGLRKVDARIDSWDREIAPSTELRRWYAHDPARWEEFRERYQRELERPQARERLRALEERATREPVTLLSASRALEISDAAVIRDLLSRRAHAGDARQADRQSVRKGDASHA